MFEHLVEESTALVCGSMASRSWYTCEKLQARATVVAMLLAYCDVSLLCLSVASGLNTFPSALPDT